MAAGRVDRQAGVIRDCALLGSQSDNGRVYLDGALQRAVVLYEKCPVRLDHKHGEKRSIRDDVGVLKGIRLSNGKVRGDLHLNLSHPLASFVLERAEKFPHTFGFSHEADGLVEDAGDGLERVTDLVYVESVDLVGVPATNKSLFESRDDERGPFAVERLFRDHGYVPTSEERSACAQLPPKLRDSYVDTLKQKAELDAENAELERLRAKFTGRETPNSLVEALGTKKVDVDSERYRKFVEELHGKTKDHYPVHGDYEEALAEFKRGLARRQ